MWICTKCESYNDESSLVCCMCSNRRENTDTNCDTSLLEKSFKSSMEDSDTSTKKKLVSVRIPRPERSSYVVQKGQETPVLQEKLTPEPPERIEKDIRQTAKKTASRPPQQNQSTMPEPEPFSEKHVNPFVSDTDIELPDDLPPVVPAPDVQPPKAAKAPVSTLNVLLGTLAFVCAFALVWVLLN